MRLSQTRFFLVLAVLMCSSFSGSAQNRLAQRRATTHGNPQIPRIVSEIDARNIEATIRKLVSFGTRNTLSDQTDPKRGIGAARDWLYGEFQKIGAASGGRLRVEKQTFLQPTAPRVPQPT